MASVAHPVLLRIPNCDIRCRANRIGAKRVQKFLEKKQVNKLQEIVEDLDDVFRELNRIIDRLYSATRDSALQEIADFGQEQEKTNEQDT